MGRDSVITLSIPTKMIEIFNPCGLFKCLNALLSLTLTSVLKILCREPEMFIMFLKREEYRGQVSTALFGLGILRLNLVKQLDASCFCVSSSFSKYDISVRAIKVGIYIFWCQTGILKEIWGCVLILKFVKNYASLLSNLFNKLAKI